MMTGKHRAPAPDAVFYATGVFFVILGGLVAAAADPLSLHKGSWLAAYLVLVCGVALATIGRAQAMLSQRRLPPRMWRIQFLTWVIGNTCVIAGTMTSKPASVALGGILLLAVLGLAMWTLGNGAIRTRWGPAYATTLLLLAASVPIGLALTCIRAS